MEAWKNSDRWGQSFADCPWGVWGRSWRRFSNAQAWISSMFNEFWGPEGAQGGLWSQAGAWRPNSLTPKPLSGSTPAWIAKLLTVRSCIISRWAFGHQFHVGSSTVSRPSWLYFILETFGHKSWTNMHPDRLSEDVIEHIPNTFLSSRANTKYVI